MACGWVFINPVYMIKSKVAFLEGRLFSSQSEFFEYFLIALIGWINSAPPKKPLSL